MTRRLDGRPVLFPAPQRIITVDPLLGQFSIVNSFEGQVRAIPETTTAALLVAALTGLPVSTGRRCGGTPARW